MCDSYVILFLNFDDNGSLLVNSCHLQEQRSSCLKAPENFTRIALAGVLPHIYRLAEEAKSLTFQLLRF